MCTQTYPSIIRRRARLAACLASVLGLTLSSAEAAPGQHLMRRPNHRSVAVSPIDLPFARIASLLKPGSKLPDNPSAALHHVTGCNDDPNDPGSLRSIVASAGTNSGDHIDFAQLPMTCSTITLNQGEAIRVDQDILYLDGPGAESLTIDANYASSVLYHFGNGTLYVSDLTLAKGVFLNAQGAYGGCIFSNANIFLFQSTVTHCGVASTDVNNPALGGGVFAGGNLTLLRSTISESGALSTNGGNAVGGGAFVDGNFSAHDSVVSNNYANVLGTGHTSSGGLSVPNGLVDIEGSTISGNSAEYVGALYTGGSGTLILNSTISGNMGWQRYGGVYSYAPLTVANSTVAFNRSVTGPGRSNGIYIGDATLTLQSSIIADNSGPLGGSDLGGFNTSVTGTDNLVGTSTLILPLNNLVNICPKLDPLADNGGLTQTHGLNHASPAIDKGNAGNTTLDQRGAPRPSGAGPDVGALERQATDKDERIHASNFDGFCDY